MENKITFDLTCKLILENGTNLQGVGEALQKFTSMHLYIDGQGCLQGIYDILDIRHSPCELLEVNKGYTMREIATGKIIHVFSKKLMKFLLSEYPNRKEKESVLNRFFRQLMFSPDQESSTEDESPIKPTATMEKNQTSYSYEIVQSEETSETLEESSEISESEESIDESVKEVRYITNFRMFLKHEDDADGAEATYLNEKSINILEDDNEIDIEDTISLSFSKFLENHYYDNVQVQLNCHEDCYGEIKIKTLEPITEELIENIEDDALLSLDDKDAIFFVKRKCETETDEISNIINVKDELIEKETYDDGQIYSSNVPLFKLPDEMIKEIMMRVDFLLYKGDQLEFCYNDESFVLMSEGDGLFSVFDPNCYFDDLPHLHPTNYPITVTNYAQLPICQFEYFP